MPEKDHNNKVYPSLEGALAQAIDALVAGNGVSWYTFTSPYVEPDGLEAEVIIVSYDEDGEEDATYALTLKVDTV